MSTTTLDAPLGTGPAAPDAPTRRKVAIICSKGTLDMAYPGLVLANAARMMGIDAVVFFTFWGMDIVREKTVDRLHAGIVGNPAMHMPNMLTPIPGMEAFATRMMRKKIDEIDVPPIREMVETLHDAGAELYACKMAMEMMDIEEDELLPQVDDVITAMEFFEKSEGAQIVFI